MGQALRGFSPVIPTLYFLTSYVDVEFSEFQKKMIPFCFIMFAVYIATGFFMGIYFVNSFVPIVISDVKPEGENKKSPSSIEIL